MPRKIPFQVVYATGESTSHPVSELNHHGPAVRGWHSSPGCPYPQEVVLRMKHPANVTRIQVLAHQYLIPERLELWLHHQQTSEPKTPSSQEYDYLGYLSLADNSSTGFAVRELQNVDVGPRLGTHLKLKLSRNHENSLNTENQVALIAVNILGEEPSNPLFKDVQPEEWNAHLLEMSSLCDDLAFSMYVEGGVAEVIRTMETKKNKAVKDERFEYARRLKSAMSCLRDAGERMGRYELAKKTAALAEDFQKATLRKEQIEVYRRSVYKALNVDVLLEVNGHEATNDECIESSRPLNSLPAAPSLHQIAELLLNNTPIPDTGNVVCAEKPNEEERNGGSASGSSPNLCFNGCSPNRASPISLGHHTGSLRRRNKSVPHSTFDDYDERAVPALRHSQTNEFLRECQTSAIEANTMETRGRSRLSERERRQAALAILVFGNDLVELFYSKQFSDREEGLTRLRDMLRDMNGANRQARAASLLLHRAIRDPVFSVYSCAAETVRTLFVEFIPGKISASEVARTVDRLLPELLTRCGDSSPRINNLAQHTILSIAACEEVKSQHLVAPALSRPVGNGTHPRLALSRLLILEQIILSQGISQDKQSGLTCRILSECGCSGLHHPAEPVRKVAERILIQVYKVNPRLVRKQLPPDDDITRRNLLYRQLFQEFDKIDAQRKRDIMQSKQQLQHNNAASEKIIVKYDDINLAHNYRTNTINRKSEKTVKYSFGHSENAQFNDAERDAHHQNHLPQETNDYSTYNSVNSQQNGGSNFPSAAGNAKYDETSKSKMDAYLREKLQEANSYSLNKSPEMFKHQAKVCDMTDKHNLHGNASQYNGEIIQCSFCGWNDRGANWNQLDQHYWRHCPMLTPCLECQQIVEISYLSRHLNLDCKYKQNFQQCKKCFEMIHIDDYKSHVEDNFCRTPMEGTEKCPLCHEDISDNGWDEHLRLIGCPKNTKRKGSFNKSIAPKL